MPTVRKTQIPPPESEDEFEDLCRDVAEELWNDSSTYRVGTRGQRQSGVDILSPAAKKDGTVKVIGIQCKKKKALTRQKLTKKDVDGSLQDAEGFSPKLDEFIIATTSSRDATIQGYCGQINHDRTKEKKFSITVWFWEDIEKLLREECNKTYVVYVTSIIPQEGIDSLTTDTVKEALQIAEELARNNYTEQAEGALSTLKSKIQKITDKEVHAIAKRIEILVLLRKEQNKQATSRIRELIAENPNDIDAWVMLNDRYVENEDYEECEKITKKINDINPDHPLSKIANLLLELHTDKDIEIRDVEPPGRNNREKSITFLVYHLYAHQKGNKDLRDKYLRKHAELLPNSPKPICYKIIYSSLDLIKDIENLTLEKIESTFRFISEQEREINIKHPISLSDEINIILEKLRLHVLKLQRFAPRHQIPPDLRESAITKLSQSYFNSLTARRLARLLGLILLEKVELDIIVEYLKTAETPLNREVAYLLISQAFLNDETLRYAIDICNQLALDEQMDYIEGIKKEDLKAVLDKLDGLSGQALFSAVSSIPQGSFTLSVMNEVLPKITDEETRASLTGMKMFLTIQQAGDDAAHKIRNEINIKEEGFYLSERISHFAASLGLWDIEAEALNRALEFTIPDEDRVQITAQLITALFRMVDFTGVLEHKDYVLKNFDKLSEHNQKVVLQVIIVSLLKLNDSERALELITKFFTTVREHFQFSYLKAEAEIAQKNYACALSTILEGLRIQPNVTREMLRACYVFLVEISNAESIKNENENVVGDGSYVKISDITTWFYIGDKKPIDATKLEISDDRYAAIFAQNLNQEIEWPPDKFQRRRKKRTIESIRAEPVYVYVRASELIKQLAEEGTAGIQAFNIEQGGGLENIKQFWQEKERSKDAFFETYKNNPIPFAFLVYHEGSIGDAIIKILTEQQGFIHINNGSREVCAEQLKRALGVLGGSPAIIDATSLLSLIEAELIEPICENITQIHYTPSVVNYIREYASRFAQSQYQVGRIAFSKNFEPMHLPYDHQKELRTKNYLLRALELFEKHAKKETDKIISSKELTLEKKLPTYITDPYAAARSRGYSIISEDYYYSDGIKVLTKQDQAQPISSLALVEALYQERKIKWDQYLNYVDHQLSNRCRLVPISARLMLHAVFGDSKSGLVIFQPTNIRKLHLSLSLSEQYGVSAKIAIMIMSEFLEMIIKDDTIEWEMFRNLLSEFLVQGLKGRDKNFGNWLLLMCKQRIESQGLIIPPANREKKFKILESQLQDYFYVYNPLY
jgi:tetratricopeptide (TPR) repeat protein